jgi:hypothetical protein
LIQLAGVKVRLRENGTVQDAISAGVPRVEETA